MNPNILTPTSGTGSLPQPTVARTRSTTTFGIETFSNDTGNISGDREALPNPGLSVTIEFRIYNISI